MPTVIGVTSEDLLLPVLDQYTPSAVSLPSPAEQSLEEAVSTAWATLETAGHLVVVLPGWLAADHRQRLLSVRSLLESDRMTMVEVDLPPLAIALLAQQLRRIAQYDLGPGVVASAASLLSHYLYAGAALGSVARLDQVSVGLGTHLASYLPGARFVALSSPQLRLERLTDDLRISGPGYATHLAVAGEGPGSEWVRGRLVREWNCQYLRELPLPAESARWWGTARLVEFAAYISDVGILYQLVSSAHRTSCRWCGLEFIGDRCEFCAVADASSRQSGQPARG